MPATSRIKMVVKGRDESHEPREKEALRAKVRLRCYCDDVKVVCDIPREIALKTEQSREGSRKMVLLGVADTHFPQYSSISHQPLRTQFLNPVA